MTKDDLLYRINKLELEKQEAGKQRERQQALYEALQEFKNNFDSRRASFDDSMQRRKKNLSQVDPFVERVRAAAGYRAKMTDMLYGMDFQNARSQIEKLEYEVNVKKQETNKTIEDLDRKIERIQKEIRRLRNEMNQLAEENADG